MSDLEKFIALYESVGVHIEAEIEVYNKRYGYQFLSLTESDNDKLIGYGGFFTKIFFDENGKFIQQGFWE